MKITLEKTGHDGAVVKSSANGLIGTGFASQYRLQPSAGCWFFKCSMGRYKATTPSSFSLTSNQTDNMYMYISIILFKSRHIGETEREKCFI